MKMKISIWDGTKTRILGIEDFDSVKDLQEFMKVINQVDDKATYRLMEVKR